MTHSQFTITEPPPNIFESNIFLKEDLPPSEQLNCAFANGVQRVCIFLEPKEGSFPRNKPKLLKADIDNNVMSKDKIQYVKFTRTNKLLLETEDHICVQEIVKLDKILGVPVTPYVQIENITSKFALHDIDTSIPLSDLGSEIQAANDVKIKELRRFTRRSPAGIQLTETVLVTIFGTNLPREIKFFYMLERIKPFYDRPRQCTNCRRFDHSASKCKNKTVCKRCSEHHPTDSCSNPNKTCRARLELLNTTYLKSKPIITFPLQKPVDDSNYSERSHMPQ